MTRGVNLRLAARLMRRELRLGELTLLALALVMAATAICSVAFFSDRVRAGLNQRATWLLAADLVVNADQPTPPAWEAEARRRGLETARSVTFPSMILVGERTALTTYKAVGQGYPLRGEVTLADRGGQMRTGRFRPNPGTAFADTRLLDRLGVRPGDVLTVGGARVTVAARLVSEPDGAMDLYNFIPRLMLAEEDLPSTGLIQTGSRARYRLMVSGDGEAIARFGEWVKPRLPRGARLENVEEARPEVRSAMGQARRFLGLTAMLTVALSAAAVAMAVRRYLARRWQQIAVLRCMGLTAGEIILVFLLIFLTVALVSGALGTGMGYAVQEIMARMVREWTGDGLPPPAPGLAGAGIIASLVLLAGFALPPLSAVRHVSPMSVLRDEIPATPPSVLAPLLAVTALLGLASWLIGEAVPAAWLMGGLAGFLAAAAALSWALVRLARRQSGASTVGWRAGLANLARRPWLSVLQMVSLSVSLMALLTLLVVRNDLIGAWQRSLPADAPNTYVINLQDGQRAAFVSFFREEGRPAPEISPAIRARLLAVNDRPVRAGDYADERARRLIEREFNLSWRDTLPPGNRVTAGRWWAPGGRESAFSVEEGLADTLGLKLGDRLLFDVTGTPVEARVGSLREVPWDSFRVNFFVLANPSLFAGRSASYMTSFRLDSRDQAFAGRLLARFPTVTVIDVDQILIQVRAMVDRLSRAVELMFGLSLLAGVLVLWAALVALRESRLTDAGLMRTLGASRGQIRTVLLSELLWLGALTGLIAALGAMVLGAFSARQLFDLPLYLDWRLVPLGVASGMGVVAFAGWPIVRRVTRTPPAVVLRSL
ncbi:ABC transporter permease [Paludibacterium paludis]|uniref:Inner membrane transport permease n=1 Tax=Paludibacterium paludis TaxID=1225769 RepID=A0A918P6D6_9NEIS|nr:FtsX-like permease family protein [Paludibacterium paludis]GGY27461.1 inner membrane transport permease [Paludibacterium paludis]